MSYNITLVHWYIVQKSIFTIKKHYKLTNSNLARACVRGSKINVCMQCPQVTRLSKLLLGPIDSLGIPLRGAKLMMRLLNVQKMGILEITKFDTT